MKKKKSTAEQTIEAVEEILMESFTPATGHILCLKSLPANLQAYEGFQWPETGHVKAPDWMPTESCGNGLHAFRWGAGDADLACTDDDAKWLVLEVKEEGIIDLDGKVKFKECEVLFCGARDVAVAIIQHHAPADTLVMYATLTGGNRATLTGGNRATLTGGDGATAVGGMWSILIIKYWDRNDEVYKMKAGLVDGVNFLPGVKYKLNDEFEFVTVNETEA